MQLDAGKMENVTYWPVVTLTGHMLCHQVIIKGAESEAVSTLPLGLIKRLRANGHKVMISTAPKASQTRCTLAELIDYMAKCASEVGIVGTKEVRGRPCMHARTT